MLYTDDFSDQRLKAWCIHCFDWISDKPSNKDHVPTKSLLSKPARQLGAKYDKGIGELFDYLPQVHICQVTQPRDPGRSFGESVRLSFCC